MAEAWRGFKKDGHWDVDVNVRNFIQTNYTPYDGDESFLEGPTEATDKLWGRLQELQKEEREHNGVLECETAPYKIFLFSFVADRRLQTISAQTLTAL